VTTVRYFAAAAEAAGAKSEQLNAATLGEALEQITATRDEHFTQVLARCALLLDGVRVDDPATPLVDATNLDVLPPFAGG